MGISSSGIGSGLDVNSIVQQLMTIEQKPLDALNTQQSSYQSKLTAYGTVKSGLSTLQTTLKKLTDASTLAPLKTSNSVETVLTAAAKTGSGATPGSYSVTVSQLAQAEKLVAIGQTDSSTTIGTGTISFNFGTINGGTVSNGKYTGATGFTTTGDTKTVTIDSSNNTLAGIRTAINKADIGVTASIVQDGSSTPYRLVLTNTSTGEASSMQISVSGDAALGDLLNHDPSNDSGQAMTEVSKAQNALLSVDGLSVSKTSNNVSDVIAGVTLTLKDKGTTSLTVAVDTAGVESNIKEFVDNYNKLNSSLKSLSSYDTTTKKSGVLNGDSTVRNIQTQIRNTLMGTVSGSSNTLNRLSSVGVALQSDGSLALNSTKLQSALTDHFDELPALFGKSDDTLIGHGFAYQLNDMITGLLDDSSGIIASKTDGINSALKRLNTNISNEESRLSRKEQSLRAQYTRLDTTMSKMSSTSSYLTQQLAALG